jgi:hypothetical protein
MLRSIHKILDALTSKEIYRMFVKLPPNDHPFFNASWDEDDKKKFIPYFNGCIGALDGTHVSVHVPETMRPSYRNRKGLVTQNVLMACTLDMNIVYVLTGWEGSASDSRIFEDAQTKGFRVPKNRYYLGDAGYANTEVVMVPYRGVRYHLKEWGSGGHTCVNSTVYFLHPFLTFL